MIGNGEMISNLEENIYDRGYADGRVDAFQDIEEGIRSILLDAHERIVTLLEGVEQ